MPATTINFVRKFACLLLQLLDQGSCWVFQKSRVWCELWAEAEIATITLSLDNFMESK